MPRPEGSPAQSEDEALIDAFLHMMRAESGMSFNTISAYGSDLREMSRFLAARGANFASCERPDLEAFFISRAGEGLSPNSAARKRHPAARRGYLAKIFPVGWAASQAQAAADAI